MPEIKEEVLIEAPAARVWAVVHEDLKNASRWTSNLQRAELVDAKQPGKGTHVRYHLSLPGWKGTVEVIQSTWNPAKKCAGSFTDGPLKGTWSYTYREKGGETRLVYEMEYELGGVLRFFGGALRGQYADGIRSTMQSLKKYVESGRGPAVD